LEIKSGENDQETNAAVDRQIILRFTSAASKPWISSF